MKYAGFLKSSFVDFPKNIAAVVFVNGCNFRCPYCHNASLVNDAHGTIEETEIFDYCMEKKRFLDGVVFSGGEISLYPQSKNLIEALKREGFRVKVDTNGTNPQYIQALMDQKLVDYIAMDIKAPFHRYEEVVNAKVDLNAIKESILCIQQSGLDYEFRTTVCKGLHTSEDVSKIATELAGSRQFVLQNFRDGEHVLGGKGAFQPFEFVEFKSMVESVTHHFDVASYRFNQDIL